MNLEERLHAPLKHNLFYRRTQSSQYLKEISSSKEKTYVVDNSVFSNTISVMDEISDHLINDNGYLRDISSLAKSLYGQLKSLYSLATENRLVISEEILKEFNRGNFVFRESYFRLFNFLESSTYFETDINVYLEKISTFHSKLEEILPYCLFTGDLRKITSMKDTFRDSDYYVPQFYLKRSFNTNKGKKFREKKISNADLNLYIISIYLNNFMDLETELLANDSDFLAQGPLIYKGKKLDSPDILSCEHFLSVSRKFQFEFYRHYQPNS